MFTPDPRFQRLALLVGVDGLEALSRARVVVAGLGGVGSWCAEALARSGVGRLILIDSDAICVTNINRQAQAVTATVGRFKADALAERIAAINPACAVTVINRPFALGPAAADMDAAGVAAPGPDPAALDAAAAAFGIAPGVHVVDAIDSLTHKLDLIETAARAGAPLYSCMGMAGKLDPTRIRVASIWETTGCPLARLVRAGLRKRAFGKDFQAVYSPEPVTTRDDARAFTAACGTGHCLCPPRDPADPNAPREWCGGKKIINGSAVTVTAAAGLVLASLVLRAVTAAP